MKKSHWLLCLDKAPFSLPTFGSANVLMVAYMRDDEYFTNTEMTIRQFCKARNLRYETFMRSIKPLIEHEFISVENIDGIKRISILSRDHCDL